MNNLYQQLNQNQSPLNSSQNNLINLFKGAKNPKAFLNNLVNTNPQMKQTMDMINNSNKSPKELFYEMANQKGIDPNSIINALK